MDIDIIPKIFIIIKNIHISNTVNSKLEKTVKICGKKMPSVLQGIVLAVQMTIETTLTKAAHHITAGDNLLYRFQQSASAKCCDN